MHGNGDPPVALAQCCLQGLHDGKITGDAFNGPLAFQGIIDPLKVGRGVVHVRLFDHDVVQLGDGIELDVAHFGALADHLLVHLAFGRHVDDAVTLDKGLA
jgi:hypothetical protein